MGWRDCENDVNSRKWRKTRNLKDYVFETYDAVQVVVQGIVILSREVTVAITKASRVPEGQCKVDVRDDRRKKILIHWIEASLTGALSKKAIIIP